MWKKIACEIFLLLLLTGSGNTQENKRLNELIRLKNFYAVDSFLKTGIAATGSYRKIYEGILLNAFGKADSSALLLASAGNNIMSDSLGYLYHRAIYDNFVKLFDYKEAFEAGSYLLKTYPAFYDQATLKDEEEEIKIWKALSAFSPQSIQQPDSSVIALKKDKAGLWNVPVSSGKDSYDFVFDSGAGISVITNSYAEKLGVQVIDNMTVDIKSGITGIITKSRVGTIAELRIKDIVLHDVVFLVFPDKSLSFLMGLYKIHGIIGFPVIKEMGELHFSKNQLLALKNHTIESPEHNLTIDELKSVIYLEYGNDRLPFTFDTGAGSTLFSNVFYNRYKSSLELTGKNDNMKIGGTSGAKKISVLIMPSLELSCAGKKLTLKKIPVSKETLQTNKDIYYGNVGQDVIEQFKTMVISFKECYVRFEN